MKTVYKYELEITDRQDIHLPKGAQFLSAQMQNGKLCVWALVESTREHVHRIFHVLGTGHPMRTDNLVYIGTAQMIGGGLVWHVFVEGA